DPAGDPGDRRRAHRPAARRNPGFRGLDRDRVARGAVHARLRGHALAAHGEAAGRRPAAGRAHPWRPRRSDPRGRVPPRTGRRHPPDRRRCGTIALAIPPPGESSPDGPCPPADSRPQPAPGAGSSDRDRPVTRRWPIVAIFVLSGAAGLIYEVVWARQLVLVFGNTTQAVSAILTGFFGGLAIGSAVGGRGGDRVRT